MNYLIDKQIITEHRLIYNHIYYPKDSWHIINITGIQDTIQDYY